MQEEPRAPMTPAKEEAVLAAPQATDPTNLPKTTGSPATGEDATQKEASVDYFDLAFVDDMIEAARTIAKNAKGHLASKRKTTLTIQGLLQLLGDFASATSSKLKEANELINELAAKVDELDASE